MREAFTSALALVGLCILFSIQLGCTAKGVFRVTVPAPPKISIFKSASEAATPVLVDEDSLERKEFIIYLPKEALEEKTSEGLVVKNCGAILAVTSSDENMVASSNITLANVQGGCQISFIPEPNASGSLIFTMISLDDPSDSLAIPISIIGINDPPAFTDLGSFLGQEDTKTTLLIPVTDDTLGIDCATAIKASSSNQNLITDSSITIAGSPPDCQLNYTPQPEALGSSIITIIFSDGEFEVMKTVEVSVTAINDPPIILDLASQTTTEDAGLTPISVNISDIDSTLNCSAISVSSSNTDLLQASSVVISGSAPDCLVSLSPGANQFGASTITVTVSDGKASTSDTFVLTVNPVNDPPTLSPVANQSILLGSTQSGAAVTLNDPDSNLSCSMLTASSSNQNLIQNSNVTFSGTAPNCFVNFFPEANQFGTSAIILSVTDGALAATQSFNFTVNPVNNPPTISDVSDQSTNEDIALNSIAVTISDIDSALSCASLTASSSNTTLIASAGVTISGTAPNCLISMNPDLNQSGSSTITLTVTDSVLTASDTFTLNVNAVNDPPRISDVSDQFIDEDNALSGVAVNIGDIDTILNCSAIAASSSDTVLIPNSSIYMIGTTTNCIMNISPSANKSGVSSITLTVSDGNAIATDYFSLTVNSINDAPVMSKVLDQVTTEDTNLSAVALNISDVDSTLSCANVIASSSNTNLIPIQNIMVFGTAPDCTISMAPAPNKNGSATIGLTVSDGTLIASDSFVFTVTAVNDPPVISDIANQSTNENINLNSIAVTIADTETSLSCASLTAASSNTALMPSASVTFSGTGSSCFLNLSPLTNQSGTSTITITVSDGNLTSNDTFVLTVNPVNGNPTISDITDKSTTEDTPLTNLEVIIGDFDSTLTCASLTASSSNTTMIPNANIVISGTAPNCLLSMTPALNQSGSSTITLTVTDTLLTATDTFVLTVSAVNDAPTISDVTDKSSIEDTLFGVAVTIGDPESALTCASLTASSSNTTLIPNASIVISGTAPNCLLNITPAVNQAGVSTITLTVSDTLLTATDTFVLTVSPVNDAPTISNVTDKSTTEDTVLSAVAVTIGDTESALTCASITASSSNTILIPNASILISGTAPNCLLSMTPALNQSGTSTITLTVTDTLLTATDTFVLTVSAVNDAPTISNVTDKSTTEDTVLSAVAVTIGDAESALTCASLTASSSNTTLIANASVVISGTAPNCLVSMTPALNQSGTSTITLTVTDTLLTASDTFVLTVSAVNDAPTISNVTDKSTTEDNVLSAVAVTIGDTESALTCASLTASSSNTTLIPNPSIVISGTAPNCLLSMTPALNQSGTSTITLTVTDTLLTATDTFVLTVSAVNDVPTISNVTDKSTAEDTALSAVAVTIGDTESALTCASLTASSSNTTLIPNANIVISGTAPNCLLSMNPALNQSGSSTITLTVTDTLLTATDTFVLTVSAVNDAPTISDVTDKSSIEDTLFGVAVTIGDPESALTCASLTASSSNTTLIPNASIVISGTAPNCLLNITPAVNQAGVSTIILTVTDTLLTATDTFVQTVSAVNDAPTISNVTDKSTTEDTVLSAVAVTIGDAESALTCAGLTASSSNTTLIANASMVISGTAPNCLLSMTPALNQSGTSTITLTVTDTLLTATDTFVLTVSAVNDAPTISNVTDKSTTEDTVLSAVAVTIGDAESALTCASLTASSSNTTLIANASVVISGTAPNCLVSMTPALNQSGTSTITLTVTDTLLTASDTFVLTVSAVNDAPTISNVTDKSTTEDNVLSAVAVTIGDTESALTCASLTASSSNTTLIPNASVVISGTAPNCLLSMTPALNQSGTSTITLTVTDTLLTATDTFVLTVSAVNDVPTISNVTDKSTTEDTAIGSFAVTIGDTDSALTCASLTASSSNTTLIANASVVISGTAPNCLFSMTPALNQSGTSTITLTVTDTLLTASDTFVLTVSAVNDAPTIPNIADTSMNEDSQLSYGAVTIGDPDSVLTCASLTASSSNTTLLPNANIVVLGTAPTCLLSITPALNQSGSSTITLTLTDTLLTATDTFVLTVIALNDAPTISNVTDKSTNEDTVLSAVAATIGDAESALTCASLTASSSNTTLIPNASIVISGTAPNCLLNITPAVNQSGTSTITLTVSDTQLTGTDTFVLTVGAVNDAPTISNVTDQLTTVGTPLSGIAVSISDVDSTLSCTSISALSSNTTLIGSAGVAFSGTAPNCLMSLTSLVNQSGTSTITLTISDGAAVGPLSSSDSFVLTVSSGIASAWSQEAYIKASNSNASNYFGLAVSISGDTAIVGSRGEDSSQTTITNGTTSSADNLALDAGASYIYKRTGSTWAQEAYLKASNSNASDNFGYAVSISGDTAIIGAHFEASSQTVITNGVGSSLDNTATNAGASYIYKRAVSTWTQEAYLKASNAEPNDVFGYAVSLSGDRAIVAAFQETSNQSVITNGTGSSLDNTLPNAGASYIYLRTGSLWTQEAYLKASNANSNFPYGSSFGTSVSISGDTAIVAAYWESSNQTVITNGTGSSLDNTGTNSGASYIYRRTGTLWAQEAYLKASNANSFDQFGIWVSVSGDTAMVGANGEDSAQTTITNGVGSSLNEVSLSSGASYIYKRTGSLWAQEAYVKASNANGNDVFGTSLSLSGDTAIVGARGEASNQTTITNGQGSSLDNSAGSAGASYIYKRTASNWAQEAYIKASNASAVDAFGGAVSISGDTAVVGAYGEASSQTTITNGAGSSIDNTKGYAGSAYIYRNLGRIFDPDLRVSGTSTNSITLSWASNLGITNRVKIAPAVLGNSNPQPCTDPSSVTLAAGLTNYVYSGLTPATKYGFRVCGFDGTNVSEGAIIRGTTN